jgi:phosphoglycolate phosphatase
MIDLLLFDCDGTLVDSQHVIVAAMGTAFAQAGRSAPQAEAIRRIIGVSLEPAMASLAPDAPQAEHQRLAELYREAAHALRRPGAVAEPLFEGVQAGLAALAGRGIPLGIATGKGRRGLDVVLEHHGIAPLFATLQTADRHPSKPHPAMALAALAETGARPEATWLIGDTSFDMAMARAAGLRPVGVAWGYHPVESLRAAGAEVVLSRFADLLDLLDRAA